MKQARAGLRIPVELPIRVRWKSRSGTYLKIEGKTGNISGNGVFANLPVRPDPETPVQMTVLLPTDVTHVPLKLMCQGRVVRWNQPEESPGVGAIIDSYELRPSHRAA